MGVTVAKKAYPSDKQDQFMLRMPDGMRDRIKRVAEANGRSMNAEIVAALEESFPSPARLEELYAAEIVEWSNRIFEAQTDDEADRLVDEANQWLVDIGLTETRFVMINMEGVPGRFPATVRQRHALPVSKKSGA